MTEQTKGLLITLAGVFILTPDSFVIRLVQLDSWTLTFWRGIFISFWVGLTLLVFFRKSTLQQFREIKKLDMLLSVLFAIGTFGFVFAIKNTGIAKVLIILSTSPVFTALFGYIFLKEKISLRTAMAMLAIVGAFFLMFSDSFQANSWWGDIAALLCGINLAVMFTIARHKKKNMLAPLFLSGFFVVFFTFPFAELEKTTTQDLFLCALLGFILGISFVLLTLGPKYIKAAEVNLLMLLETVLGSFLAWIILKEIPGNKVIIGGVVILLALIVSFSPIKKRRSSKV